MSSKKGRHEEHEHENEERWLISYADFITLLMALFIVMYAMSNVDKARFQKLAVSLSGAFNVAARSPVNMPTLAGRKGDNMVPILKDRPTPPAPEGPAAPDSLAAVADLQKSMSPAPDKDKDKDKDKGKDRALLPAGVQGAESPAASEAKPATQPGDQAGMQTQAGAQQQAGAAQQGQFTQEQIQQALQQYYSGERKTLEQVKSQIDDLLKMQGLAGEASVSISKSGRVLNVRLPDSLLFTSGSADLSSDAGPVLDKMATIIERAGQKVRVEGHTDNIPIRSGKFASNWDLSTARATRVLMYLQEMGSIPPGKLAAAGYGEFRPLGPNDTPEGRAKNRRVEFVITAEDLEG